MIELKGNNYKDELKGVTNTITYIPWVIRMNSKE
jgi:hypothetical protein